MPATQPQLIDLPQQAPTAATWSTGYRVAFRFYFLYLALFCLLTPILGCLLPIPGVDLPDMSTFWPFRNIVFWTAAHVFHATSPLVYRGSGSGDKTFDWLLSFCLLVVAALATVLWALIDRKHRDYATLCKWFRIFLRLALAGTMIAYGMAKTVPVQMPFPSLSRLLTPYGNFSPAGVLWYSVGASPSYEIFAGCAETLGGVLLIVPRTTMLGALICLADLIQVFMLNMTYDVAVKLFSFHLLLISVLLLAPDFGRLSNFLLLNRATPPSTLLPLFASRRANLIALVVQVVFGIGFLAGNIVQSRHTWKTYGGGQVHSPLYGIWSVVEMSIDGHLRSPLTTDYGRWRHIIFDSTSSVSFQRMDGSFADFGASIDVEHKTIALKKPSDAKWKSNFIFVRSRPDQLSLDGSMDTHKVHMDLKLVNREKFLLLTGGFHWIQEYPFIK